MSLILEALRKSEAERRRGSTPDVAMELPPASLPRVRANPPWMLSAVAIGALALIVAWWWSRQDAAMPAGVPAVATARPAPASIDSPAPRVVMTPPTQTPVIASTPPPVPPVAAASPLARAGIVDAVQMAGRPLPQPVPVDVAEAPDIDATSLPPVKLSMHMWDASPGKRFVILDGQRMSEGDRKGEVTVVSIERDGVVVERKGVRARVPLP